jgi:hypothetical protein
LGGTGEGVFYSGESTFAVSHSSIVVKAEDAVFGKAPAYALE